MATVKRAIYLMLLAVAAPYIYERYLAITSLLANRPGKLEHVYSFKSHEIKFADQLKNCEDVVLEEELGISFVSCDPGRDRWNTVMGTFHPPHPFKPHFNNGAIWLYNYLKSPDSITPLTFTNFPNALDFHPLGLTFDSATSQLYVINHPRHSNSVIEIFQLSLDKGVADHIQTLSDPLLHAPNALELLSNGRLLVTNDHYIRAAVSPLLSKIEMFTGAPGGTVVSISPIKPFDAKVVARVPFANGIVKLNDSTLVVASSSKPGIYFYHFAANGVDLDFREFIRTPAGTDNLSVDSKGKLLIAGHPFVPSLVEVAEGRPKCDEDGTEEQRKACACWAPSWVGEWSEEAGLRTLLRDGGEKVCSSSTAVREVKSGVGLVSMLYGRGVVVFRE